MVVDVVSIPKIGEKCDRFDPVPLSHDNSFRATSLKLDSSLRISWVQATAIAVAINLVRIRQMLQRTQLVDCHSSFERRGRNGVSLRARMMKSLARSLR